MEPRDRTLGWVVGPTYELTRRIFERVVAAVRTRLAHRVIEHLPREHRILVVNFAGGTSELRARSADRPDGLLGESVDFVVVDEAASIREGVWDECLAPRLIDMHGWALLIGTPHGRGWFYEQFKLGQKRRDPAYESWQAPTTQNPHVDAALIEAERKRLNADLFAERYEAEFLGPPEPCEVCGGPSPEVMGSALLFGDEALQHCHACGRAVDAHGRTLVTAWNGVEQPVQVIVVHLPIDEDTREGLIEKWGPRKWPPELPV
jgi:hypothetical protein